VPANLTDKLTVEIDVDTGKAKKGFADYDSAVSKTASATDKLQGSLAKNIVQGNLLSAAIQKGAGALVSFGKSSVAAAAQTETLKANLQAFFGSAERTETAFKGMREQAARLPLSINQIAAAFSSLGGAGLATADIARTIDMLDDAAQGSSEKFERLAQNFQQITAVGEALRAQLETVFRGVGVAAAKSGMLGSPYAVELTREFIASYRVKNYVLDPVMVCKGAGEALNPELNQAVADKLLPLAEVVTPNLFEASQLSGLPEATTLEAMKETARVIVGKGAHTVFVKGGAKLAGAAKAFDVFYDGNGFEVLEAELLKTNWTHGAGCTTSAAIAAGLARGLSVRAAVRLAKRFITQSLAAGFPLNKWVGPGNPASWRKAY
jgi:pyridoxine kinase